MALARGTQQLKFYETSTKMNFPHKRILKSTDIKERKTKIHTLFKVLVHKLHILYHLRRHGGCLLRRTPILFRFPPFRFSVLGGLSRWRDLNSVPASCPHLSCLQGKPTPLWVLYYNLYTTRYSIKQSLKTNIYIHIYQEFIHKLFNTQFYCNQNKNLNI